MLPEGEAKLYQQERSRFIASAKGCVECREELEKRFPEAITSEGFSMEQAILSLVKEVESLDAKVDAL